MSPPRSSLRSALAAAAVALPLTLATGAAAEEVLRVVPQADLKNIDPIWTTAIITRNHGFMVYDTLFGKDEQLNNQPQMVGDYSVSDDQLTYTFTLRDGLMWHDGQPVTAADCVASIERWAVRDGSGQKLMELTESLTAVDDKTIELKLKEPYGLVIDSLAKIGSNAPFMMPKRHAETDPFEQVSEVIGSGPFEFVAEEWVPGAKVVYQKFADYVPRDEPASGSAGGKVVNFDRVEWLYIPDPQTAMNALINGEVDIYEQPPVDLLPVLEQAEGVEVEVLDPVGNQGVLRLNHLYPPFDHPKAREAMLYIVNQEDYLRAVVGNPNYYQTCGAFMICGSPMETDVATEKVMSHDLEKARQLFAEAGYDGEPIVILHPTDFPVLNAATLVTAQFMRQAGLNVELQAMDWSTLTSRRAVSDPVDEGGWNIFHTYAGGVAAASPIEHIAMSAGGKEQAWFGWPEDAEIERLRDAWAREPDLEERKKIAEDIQRRAYEVVLYVPYGQWTAPIAYRDDLIGLVRAPASLFLWNIDRVE